jgi:cytochrome d ubiquinol oxidase subunit I
MNYPVWDVPILGGGMVVAIIAIIHVLISHFAVGGGALLFVAELWSDRQPDGEKIRGWLRKYATFFLVYTTVFGAMTGVGIWFSIQLASPEGTSLLIHQFVFAWAIEWVMFLGELTVLYLYYYGWDSNSRRLQIWLAGLYFLIAWGSLVVINGILTFMLTPGGWTLANRDILAGFLNPGYLPSLLIRTVVMFLVAGLGALMVASFIKDGNLKERIVTFAAKWVIPGAVFAPLLFYWYGTTLPQNTVELLSGGITGIGGGRMEVISIFFGVLVVAGALLVLASAVYLWKPRALTFSAALAMFLIAQLGIMGGEFAREMARKPFVIYDTLYSNALWQHDALTPGYLETSYLTLARWHPDAVEPLSAAHGASVFRLQCGTCHTRHGYRQIAARTDDWTGGFGFKWLKTMDQQGVMPPFSGDDEDRAALTAYVMSLSGKAATGAAVLEAVAREEESPEAAKGGEEVAR